MSNMIELAEMCEKATGPSYALDCQIWDAIYPGERDERFAKVNASYGDRLGPADKDGYVKPLRAFTASIDAAMTLVPEGWRVATFGEHRNGGWDTIVICDASDDEDSYQGGRARTGPLALCAAALKARARTHGDRDG